MYKLINGKVKFAPSEIDLDKSDKFNIDWLPISNTPKVVNYQLMPHFISANSNIIYLYCTCSYIISGFISDKTYCPGCDTTYVF